jgi:Fe-S oxidoreductase
MNITEEPRRILENIPGLKFVELEAHGYETNCCGGGGGLPITNPRLSIEIAKKRLNEVKELGVGTLVTACPTCHYMFEKVVKYLHLQVKILDIIDLLLMSTKGDENKYV